MTTKTEKLAKQIKTPQKVVGHEFYQTTGSTLVNMTVSAGEDLGFPFGGIVNITGKKGSGKTFLAVEGIYASMKKYPGKVKHTYDDTEGGNRFNTEALYGYKLNRINSKTYERMGLQLNKDISELKSDELLVYVNDSWDANSTDAEQKNLEKATKNFNKTGDTERDDTYGGMARALVGSTFFRDNIDTIEKSKTLMIIMSQVRTQTAGRISYEGKSGGHALDHYPDTILKIKKTDDVVSNGLEIGAILYVFCPKNRTARPFRGCHIRIYFKMGIDEIGSNLIYLYDLLTPEGKFKTSKVSPTKTMIPKIDWDEKYVNTNEKPVVADYWTLDEACQWIEDNEKDSILKRKVMRKWNDTEEEAEKTVTNRKQKSVF